MDSVNLIIILCLAAFIFSFLGFIGIATQIVLTNKILKSQQTINQLSLKVFEKMVDNS